MARNVYCDCDAFQCICNLNYGTYNDSNIKTSFYLFFKKKSIPVAQTVVTSLLLGTVLTMSMPKTSHADEVQDIVNRSDDASKFLSSTASAKFILTSKNGEQRVRLTKNMTKLAGNTQNNMRLTEFISPADVQGTTTLLIENAKGSDSMFVYLPALKSTPSCISE